MVAGPNNTPVLDSFGRADSVDLGANWGINPYQQPNMGSLRLSNGAARSGGTSFASCGNWWLPNTFLQDVEVFATIVGLQVVIPRLLLATVNPGSGPIGGLGNIPANFRCYIGGVNSSSSYSIQYQPPGSGAQTLALGSGATFVSGNRLAFSYVGGTLIIWADTGSGWQSQLSVAPTGSQLINQGGSIGMTDSGTTNTGTEGFADFGGGSVPLAQSLLPQSVSGQLRT